jgi:hypothetical protein
VVGGRGVVCGGVRGGAGLGQGGSPERVAMLPYSSHSLCGAGGDEGEVSDG